MKKKILSLLLTLSMVLSFFPGMSLTAHAAKEPQDVSDKIRLTCKKDKLDDLNYTAGGIYPLYEEHNVGVDYWYYKGFTTAEADAALQSILNDGNNNYSNTVSNWSYLFRGSRLRSSAVLR